MSPAVDTHEFLLNDVLVNEGKVDVRDRAPVLTEHERECLLLTLEGYTLQQAGYRLCQSVPVHVDRGRVR